MKTMFRSIWLTVALAVALPAHATITGTASRNELVADGASTAFTFTFPTQAAGDVQVLVGGTVQISGYTVALNASQSSAPGGTVTFSAPPAASSAIVIQRVVPLTQGTHLTPYGPFPSSTIESTFDRLTMGIQQVDRVTNDATDALCQLQTYYALHSGPPGPAGPAGPAGPQGPAGPAGPASAGVAYRGAWDVATAYALNDVITYGGSTYICVTANTGHAPTDTAYWNVLAQAGTTTAGITYLGTWSSTASYTVNQLVTYNGSSYICIFDNTGQLPTNSAYWAVVAQAGTSTVGAVDTYAEQLAGSKTKVIYKTSPPTVADVAPAAALNDGDIWFDTSTYVDNPATQGGSGVTKIKYDAYRWSSTAGGTGYQGTNWISAASTRLLTANEIAAGAVTADKLDAVSINASSTLIVGQAQVTGLGTTLAGKLGTGTAANDVNTGITKIQGGQLVNHTVTTDQLYVTQLSAITANAGTITSGLLTSADNKARFNLSGGYVVFNNGTVMHVLGNGFGAASGGLQFIEWVGPSQGAPGSENLTLCTEANAKFFVRTDGVVKYAGLLAVGQAVNQVQGTTLTNANVADLSFTSAGGGITITTTYLFSGSTTFPGTTAGLSSYNATVKQAPSITLVLSRSINGGAFTDVATYTPSGSWDGTAPIPASSEAGGYGQYANGTWTYLDTANLAQPREYRVRIATWSNINTTVSQNTITLQSVE